jgi:oxygen-independent coproporphyrinogen-3 oxidase
VEKYTRDIRKGKLPIAQKEKLSREQMFMEAVYLGFRTTKGIDIADFERRFDINFLKTFGEKISEFEKSDLLNVSPTHCALTRNGMVLLDSITAAFTNQGMHANR